MSTIRISVGLTNIDNGQPLPGAIPGRLEDTDTTSSVTHQSTQLVGTTEAVLSAGSVTDNALCVIRNNHATAVVSLGVVVSSTFYPLFAIHPGKTAVLPRITSLAGTYVKSTAANTDILVSLFKIA